MIDHLMNEINQAVRKFSEQFQGNYDISVTER